VVLECCPLSLLRLIEKILERKYGGFVYKPEIIGSEDPLR
jgi:hypothetical protein